MYLLDTTTISDYLKGEKSIIKNLHYQNPKDLAISVISQYEIEYGLRKNPSLRQYFAQQLEELYDKTNTIEIDSPIAKTAAAIKHQLTCEGKIIAIPDILIGATALCSQLTVVTSNTKDFLRIDTLQIVDWKKAN